MPRPKAAAIGKPSSVIKATASDIYFIVWLYLY